MKLKKRIKIAIDSPAAAGAGTVAKKICKHYNLLYLDTGKIYRYLAYLKTKNPKKFNLKFVKKEMKSLSLLKLNKKSLIKDEIGVQASIIAKNRFIRKLVHDFQVNIAYNQNKKFNGSCLDGRDITYKIIPDAEFKFFITANVNVRAERRFKELKLMKKSLNFKDVLKSIKKRDKNDYNRKISPLKKTKDSVLINTTNLTKRSCFLKIKKIIDKELNKHGNL